MGNSREAGYEFGITIMGIIETGWDHPRISK
jgi:hypothetical protein